MWAYNYTVTPTHDELCHYGVLGMRWGQRRAKRAVKKYSDKAQRQIDANMRNAKSLKKSLDSDWDDLTESRLAKETRKAYTHEYKNAIDNAKKWTATRNDIMNMKVSDIKAADVKKRFNDSKATGSYYPFA